MTITVPYKSFAYILECSTWLAVNIGPRRHIPTNQAWAWGYTDRLDGYLRVDFHESVDPALITLFSLILGVNHVLYLFI